MQPGGEKVQFRDVDEGFWLLENLELGCALEDFALEVDAHRVLDAEHVAVVVCVPE